MKSLHPATYDPSTGTFRCTPPGEEPFELAREAVEDLLALARVQGPIQPVEATRAPEERELRETIVKMIRVVDETAEAANPRAYAIARGERVDPPVSGGDPGAASGSLAVHRASRHNGLRLRALAAEVGIVVADVLNSRGGSGARPRVAVGIDWAASRQGPHLILTDHAGNQYVLSDKELAAWGGISTPSSPSASLPAIVPPRSSVDSVQTEESLPEDLSEEIEHGMADVAAGRVIPHAEVRERIYCRSYLKPR